MVFIDNLNMQPQNRNPILKKLRDFVQQQFDPRDRIMLVSLTNQVQVEQEFTSDRDLLLATIDRLQEEQAQMGSFDLELKNFMREMQRVELVDEGAVTNTFRLDTTAPEATAMNGERLAATAKMFAERQYQRVQSTISTLGRFTETLAGLPGRKAILYVSDGLHVRPAEPLFEAWQGKFQGWIARNGGGISRDMQRAGRELEAVKLDATRDFRQLVEFASANKVAFYPLANLGSLSRSSVSAEFEGSNASDGQGALSASYNALDTASRESSLLQIADGTGGVAFTRTNNIGGLLEAMSQDFTTFYSLGYNSPVPAGDRQFHKIEVKVRRPGAQVRHFQGYLTKDPLDELQALTLSALQYGMADNPLDISVETGKAVPAGKRYQVPVVVKIPFGRLLLLPQEGFHTGRVSLFLVVRDEKTGGLSKPQHIELPIQVPNERLFDAVTQAVGYPVTLELDSGPKRIAVGIRDNLARLEATLKLDFTVGNGPS